MEIDHVSYVTSHSQISDVINRIGLLIGSPFIDGGIHPRFGTRNFTAPLKNGQYIEVVCPIDHPATDQTNFGIAVRQKALNGGGWFAWVIRTTDIEEMEKRIERKAIEGDRVKPNGTKLKWKQLGVKELSKNGHFPFFVQWQSDNHPSKDLEGKASISAINLRGPRVDLNSWIDSDIANYKQIALEDTDKTAESEIVSVTFESNGNLIEID
jgi:Glyoxalase-like domain